MVHDETREPADRGPGEATGVGRGAPLPGRGERGQAAVLVVVVATVIGAAVLVGLAELGRGLVDRSRAQTAADAAARASLDGGRSAAARLAAEHGATVVEWSGGGSGVGEVTVTVRRGRATATARATDAVDGPAPAEGAVPTPSRGEPLHSGR